MYEILTQALQTLAGVCDGAKEDDGVGFNGRDTRFGKSLAEQSLTRTLSPNQQATAIKMLQTYKAQLKGHGIVLPSILEYAGGKPTQHQSVVINDAVTQVTVSATDGEFAIQFPYNPTLVERVKALARRRFDKTSKLWLVPADMEAEIRQTFDGYPLIWDEAAEQLSNATERVRRASARDAYNVTIPNLTGTLMPFQQAGVAFIDAAGGRAIIGDDMGLGKTIQAIGYLALHPEYRPAVIVVPASLKPNWRREIEKWLTANQITHTINGKKPDPLIGSALIYIINYDILDAHIPALRAIQPQVLIADEAHMVKSPKAARTKATLKLAEVCDRVILMSGTPIMNRPAELFPLLQAVQPGRWSNFMTYARRYCNARQVRMPVYNPKTRRKEFRNVWDFDGASNLPELNDKLKTVMIRRLKGNVLTDLPEKRRVMVPFAIDMKKYGRFMESTLAELEAAGNQAAQMVIVEKAKQYVVEQKMPQIFEWIDNFLESGEKLILFCIHKATVAALMDRYKEAAVKITGDSSQEERDHAVQAFQREERVQVFVGNIQAAGVGLTLTAASNVAFIELAWTPGHQTQAEDRAHRIGQTNAVTAWYLLAESTVEESTYKLLEKKRETVDLAIDGEVSAFGFNDGNVAHDLIEELLKGVK